MNLNLVVFGGRIGQDPEAIKVGETTKCTLRVASTRRFQSKGETKEDTTWMDVICWGKLADIVSEHCIKGQEVSIVGRLLVETWEKDGQKRSATRIVADDVNFGSKPGAKTGGVSTGGGSVSPDMLKKYLKAVVQLKAKGIDEDVAITAAMETVK